MDNQEHQEVDFREPGPVKTPASIRAKYLSVVSQVVRANPNLTSQEAYDEVKATEKRLGIGLSQILVEEATPANKMSFERKRLRLKGALNILSEEEKIKLAEIDSKFLEASRIVAKTRNITVEESDTLLMQYMSYRGILDIDEAVERLTKGPKISGFDKSDIADLSFDNEEVRKVLDFCFGEEAILQSREVEIVKEGGFAINCQDVQFGNECISKYKARWSGTDIIVFPDRDSYEQAEMQLEGVTNKDELQHVYKLRASTSEHYATGYATTRIREFVVEKSSHFNYLADLPLTEDQKMKVYFLGTITHEVVHALHTFGIDQSIYDDYCKIAREETSALDHRFVSKYVDRHQALYRSPEHEILGEDFAESVRIYLTNSAFLRKNYPQRYAFIKDNLPFLRGNGITEYIREKSRG